ncbi:MAG: hypothetical protein ACI4U4_03625 [Bacilli bacterium]
MRNKWKIILSFSVFTMLILFVICSVFNKKQKNVLEENTIELESNTVRDNVIDTLTENAIEQNPIDNSDTVIENKIEETIKTVETTTKVENKKTDEKPKTSSTTTNVSSSKPKTQITSESTQTKDETNNNKIVKPTTNENTSNINNNNDNTTKKIEPEETKQEQTIKKISQEEYNAEVQRYLRDIQSIKPGLKYKNAKRGQVFWPYRTSEIEIAVGGVSFGTVYYYVEIFVEGNQEKFKYYIDWVGNE